MLNNIPKVAKMNLISREGFSNGVTINSSYSRNGGNKLPELSWEPVKNAVSYAMICVDIHPKAHGWIHLFLPFIHNSIHSITDSFLKNNNSLKVIGENSFGEKGWDGPQPPPGTGIHQYVFVVFALDSSLENNHINKIKSLKDFIHILKNKKINILSYGLWNMFYRTFSTF